MNYFVANSPSRIGDRGSTDLGLRLKDPRVETRRASPTFGFIFFCMKKIKFRKTNWKIKIYEKNVAYRQWWKCKREWQRLVYYTLVQYIAQDYNKPSGVRNCIVSFSPKLRVIIKRSELETREKVFWPFLLLLLSSSGESQRRHFLGLFVPDVEHPRDCLFIVAFFIFSAAYAKKLENQARSLFIGEVRGTNPDLSLPLRSFVILMSSLDSPSARLANLFSLR